MRRIALILLAVSVSASADLYKCPVKGQNAYQEKPCAQGEKLDVPEVKSVSERAGPPNTPLKIGMRDTDVYSAWGLADKVNRTVRADGVSEQWVYRRRHGRTQYLYFENGILTSAQTPE